MTRLSWGGDLLQMAVKTENMTRISPSNKMMLWTLHSSKRRSSFKKKKKGWSYSANSRYYCGFPALLNNYCLTQGISRRSEMVSQTGVRLCLAYNKLWLSGAAHMLSLSQADEWLWPLFIITKWLEEIMTGIFLQASLCAHVTVSQSSFSAAQGVF